MRELEDILLSAAFGFKLLGLVERVVARCRGQFGGKLLFDSICLWGHGFPL